MTPQEIQRMMDFILRRNADSVIRMDRMEEKHQQWTEEFKEKLDTLHIEVRETSREVRALVKENRAHEKRIRRLEKSDRRARHRSDGMRDAVKILVRLMTVNSKRIGRLEQNSR